MNQNLGEEYTSVGDTKMVTGFSEEWKEAQEMLSWWK